MTENGNDESVAESSREQLRERVERLESSIESLHADTEQATDQEGREWTIERFLQLGLTRREAVLALGAIASGYAFREALLSAVGTVEAGSDQVGTIGTPTEPVDIVAEDIQSESVSTGEINNTLEPEPGEVQTALDNARDAGDVTVRLHSGKTYDPADTLDVWSDVTLDYNGAVIVPTTDQDILNVHPGSTVLNPRHDTTDITFTSNVFVLDANQLGKFDYDDPTKIKGGWSYGRRSGPTVSGTLFYLHQNQTVAEPSTYEYIEFVEVEHDAIGFDTHYDLHSEGSEGYINSCQFEGEHHVAATLVHQRGGGMIQTNVFNIHSQTDPAVGQYGWRTETGANNLLEGQLWDTGGYAQYLWSNEGGSNNTMRIGIRPTSDQLQSTSGTGNMLMTWDGSDLEWMHISSGVKWRREIAQYGIRYHRKPSGGSESLMFEVADDGAVTQERMRFAPQSSVLFGSDPGDVALAGSGWDPDGDGNGELVIFDGTAWQEILDLPNLT